MSESSSEQSTQGKSSVSYGVSDHYTGERGQVYQQRRNRLPLERIARIQAEKFAPAIREADTVVDFGCGSGEILSVIDCERRIGIEVNPTARAQAQDRGIECFAYTSELPKGIADVVISHHVLEHVPYPIQALSELREVLKPDGWLRICVPAENPRKTGVYNPNDVPHHLHTWTVQLLGNTLIEAGYEVTPESVWTLTRRFPRPLLNVYPRLPQRAVDVVSYGFALIRQHREIMAYVRPSVGNES